MIITSKKQKGFSLVEVMTACSIITVCVFALMSASEKGIGLSTLSLRQTQSSFLLEEGAEAVKSIRDASWSNVSNLSGTYYLSYSTSTNTWSLSSSNPINPTNPIDSIFTRSVVFASVNRDSNYDITTSGGTLDSRTKKVTVTVSWTASGSTVSKTLSFYLLDAFT